MNILKRISLQQIVARKDVIRSIIDIKSLQVRRLHHTNYSENSIKSLHFCTAKNNGTHKTNSYRWYSMKTREEKTTKTATTTTTIKPRRTLMEVILDYFRTTKSVIAGKAVLVYGQGVDQLNHTEFLTKFQLPNTFNTWFLITELHVWMLMVRAMAERDHGVLIRNNMVETLWSDAMVRTKSLAPGESRQVKKQIKELSGQFQYAIISYDEGLTKDDKQLASALWKRFFSSNCDNYEHIELMVKYIRYNIAVLDKLTTDEFLTKRNIVWPSLKKMESDKC